MQCRRNGAAEVSTFGNHCRRCTVGHVSNTNAAEQTGPKTCIPLPSAALSLMIICFHSLDQFFFCKIRPGKPGKMKLAICRAAATGNWKSSVHHAQNQIRNSKAGFLLQEVCSRDPCRSRFSTLYTQFFHCTDDLMCSLVIIKSQYLEIRAIVVLVPLSSSAIRLRISSSIWSCHPDMTHIAFSSPLSSDRSSYNCGAAR